MRPHPNKWLITGLVKRVISLAAVNTVLEVVAIAAAVVFGVGVTAIMIVAPVDHIVANIRAVTIIAIPMPVGHVHRTTRTTPQGLAVMEVQPPVLI